MEAKTRGSIIHRSGGPDRGHKEMLKDFVKYFLRIREKMDVQQLLISVLTALMAESKFHEDSWICFCSPLSTAAGREQMLNKYYLLNE